MLIIRLTRKGKKNQPFFRVVVIDKRSSTRGGRSVEDLGYVDPLKKRKSLNAERIKYWLSKGAQASDTMHNLLVAEKIIEADKVHVSKLSKKAKEKMKTTAEAKVAAEEAAKAKAEKDAEDAKAEKEKPAEEVVEAPVEEVKPEETTPEVTEEKPAE
jgi:small subunit ribosomal protein S16